jgi:hypothetical protein
MPLHVSVFRDHHQRDTFTSIQLEATITIHVLKVKMYTYNINMMWELGDEVKVVELPYGWSVVVSSYNDIPTVL